MSEKINVVLMPMFIDRIREFVSSPTAKTWSAVSRLVKNTTVHSAVNFGLRGGLPVMLCEAKAHYFDCDGCQFVALESAAHWHRLRCLPYLTMKQKTLAQRLFIANRVLAIYDSYDGMSSFESKQMVKHIDRLEATYKANLLLRKKTRTLDTLVDKLRHKDIDEQTMDQLFKLISERKK